MKKTAIILSVSVGIGLASQRDLAAQATPAPSSPATAAAPAGPAGANELTARLDVPNFCCPDYIAALRKSVADNWQAPPDLAATTIVRVVIERDGQISRAIIELPSGVALADARALRAVQLAKPAPLPAAFNQPPLVVHLTFESAAKLASAPGTSIEFDSQGVDFRPWLRGFMAQVRRNWLVPRSALTQKGRTVVSFSVSRTGEIRNVKIVEPSGVVQFDRSAFNAVAGANPLEPLPPAYPKDEVQFTVSFYYNDQPPAR